MAAQAGPDRLLPDAPLLRKPVDVGVGSLARFRRRRLPALIGVLGQGDEKSFGPADVTEPIQVFVLDHFAADELRAVLTESGESSPMSPEPLDAPRPTCGSVDRVAGVRLRMVDAFTDVPFSGNPAAVVFVDEAPSDAWMAAVARETGVSDTAFVIRERVADADFRIRWFTPAEEVDLCGHATLASAHCLLEDGARGPIRFASRSGVLVVKRLGDGSLAMDFPAWPPTEIDAKTATSAALSVPVEWTGQAHDGFFLLALLADERSVRNLAPDLSAIGGLEFSAVIVTAAAEPGQSHDFVSRLFAPKVGIPEDPVTGSSHSVLGPFWADRFGRSSLVGLQTSSRPGRVGVDVAGGRVTITGRATTVLDGQLTAVAQPA